MTVTKNILAIYNKPRQRACFFIYKNHCKISPKMYSYSRKYRGDLNSI